MSMEREREREREREHHLFLPAAQPHASRIYGESLSLSLSLSLWRVRESPHCIGGWRAGGGGGASPAVLPILPTHDSKRRCQPGHLSQIDSRRNAAFLSFFPHRETITKTFFAFQIADQVVCRTIETENYSSKGTPGKNAQMFE